MSVAIGPTQLSSRGRNDRLYSQTRPNRPTIWRRKLLMASTGNRARRGERLDNDKDAEPYCSGGKCLKPFVKLFPGEPQFTVDLRTPDNPEVIKTDAQYLKSRADYLIQLFSRICLVTSHHCVSLQQKPKTLHYFVC
ncbi:hypothetical protein RRG08_050636 [Elysia crispata]|uniref:Uncharacterized protein n=1 Tax=Elysia crispata TaxID=231223 RepID=A0AAE1D9A0_9GAST|nr:hypothetical protein RRG08_050636 [Elysia crispata]